MFVKGRANAASRIIHTPWSVLWAFRFATWQQHCERMKDWQICWSPLILRYKDSTWLHEQRLANYTPSRALGETRLSCRASAGTVAKRWSKSLPEALQLVKSHPALHKKLEQRARGFSLK